MAEHTPPAEGAKRPRHPPTVDELRRVVLDDDVLALQQCMRAIDPEEHLYGVPVARALFEFACEQGCSACAAYLLRVPGHAPLQEDALALGMELAGHHNRLGVVVALQPFASHTMQSRCFLAACHSTHEAIVSYFMEQDTFEWPHIGADDLLNIDDQHAVPPLLHTLLRPGAAHKIPMETQASGLMSACAAGNTDAVQLYLAPHMATTLPFECDIHGEVAVSTLLSPEILSMFTRHASEVGTFYLFQEVFENACAEGVVWMVQHLLDSADEHEFHALLVVSNTAVPCIAGLEKACMYGRVDVITLLMSDPRMTSSSMCYLVHEAFMRACGAGSVLVSVQAMLRAPASQCINMHAASPPLARAAREGSMEVVEELLSQRGAHMVDLRRIGVEVLIKAMFDTRPTTHAPQRMRIAKALLMHRDAWGRWALDIEPYESGLVVRGDTSHGYDNLMLASEQFQVCVAAVARARYWWRKGARRRPAGGGQAAGT